MQGPAALVAVLIWCFLLGLEPQPKRGVGSVVLSSIPAGSASLGELGQPHSTALAAESLLRVRQKVGRI